MGDRHVSSEWGTAKRPTPGGIDYLAHGPSAAAGFEWTAHHYPERIAVCCPLGEISYAELNAAANRLAHRFLAGKGQRGDRVAILMPQDRRLFVAMLGALKAGRIVLILNGADPPARQRQLLDDAAAGVILTVAGHVRQAEQLAAAGRVVLRLDCTSSGDTATNPGLDLGPDDTAFLVYTSGSTGAPKGVMQTHGHTLRDALDVRAVAGIRPDDRILLLASLWGAQALCTTWITFINAATLVAFPVSEHGLTGLEGRLVEQRISVFISASSLCRQFLKGLDAGTRFPAVRLVKLSADPATRDDFERVGQHFPNAVFMHAIGVTELGHLAYLTLSRDAAVAPGRLPIGWPFPGVDLRILDDQGRDCPVGTIGSVTARLRYLAAGYWRDPALTARCFAPAADGGRTYRGGDLAHLDAAGRVVLAGRADATCKIRGQRVDLAEVEQALAGLPAVGEAAVVAAPRPGGELQLVAYAVPAPDLRLSPRWLRSAARACLPRHLVPALFVMVDALPRAANGKLDRSQLRDRAPPLLRAGTLEPPETETESLLAGLWATALDLDLVGRRDDFFELGGDSLAATLVAALLHETRGVDLEFATFVDYPLLLDLAAHLDALGREVPCPVPRRQAGTDAPLAVVQEYYWRRSLDSAAAAGLVLAAAGRLEGPLDSEALRLALADVLARHDILRTRFEVRPGRASGLPLQVVEPPGAPPLEYMDLAGTADAEGRAAQLLDEARVRVFDISAAPPLAFTLLRLRADCHVLLQSSHHIVADGPSWNIFLADLAHCYAARLGGDLPSLPALAVQYGDYAAWERQRWRRGGDALRQAVAWWRQELAQAPRPPAAGWLPNFRRQEPAGPLCPDDWSIAWGLDMATSVQLDQLGQTLNATYFAVRLAAMVPVCALASGQERVMLGVVRTTRTRAELQPLFGPFLSYGTPVLACDWKASFRELVAGVRSHLAAMQRQAEAPYSLVVEELAAQGIAVPPPLMLVHRMTPVAPMGFCGLRLTWSSGNWHPLRSGIMVRFDELNERDGCLLVFDARVYSTAAMRAFAGALAAFTEAMAANPDVPLSHLLAAGGASGPMQTLLAGQAG